MRGEIVAQLRWRAAGTSAPGWYVWQPGRGWRRLAVAPELDAALAEPAVGADSQDADELAATLSTALALDAAAELLRGPLTRPSRPLRTGRYELHVSGLTHDVVPVAFPETIAVRAGDISVLAGHFDDVALARISRRIALLGGRLLALFHADQAQ